MMVKVVQNSEIPEPASDEINVGDVFYFVMDCRDPNDPNNLRVVHKIESEYGCEDRIFFLNGSWALRRQIFDSNLYIRRPSS